MRTLKRGKNLSCFESVAIAIQLLDDIHAEVKCFDMLWHTELSYADALSIFKELFSSLLGNNIVLQYRSTLLGREHRAMSSLFELEQLPSPILFFLFFAREHSGCP